MGSAAPRRLCSLVVLIAVAVLGVQMRYALGQSAPLLPKGMVETNGLKARTATAEDVLGAWTTLDIRGDAGTTRRYVLLLPDDRMFSLSSGAAAPMTEKQLGQLLAAAAPVRYAFNHGLLVLNYDGTPQEVMATSFVVEAPVDSTIRSGDLLCVLIGSSGTMDVRVMRRLPREWAREI